MEEPSYHLHHKLVRRSSRSENRTYSASHFFKCHLHMGSGLIPYIRSLALFPRYQVPCNFSQSLGEELERIRVLSVNLHGQPRKEWINNGPKRVEKRPPKGMKRIQGLHYWRDTTSQRVEFVRKATLSYAVKSTQFFVRIKVWRRRIYVRNAIHPCIGKVDKQCNKSSGTTYQSCMSVVIDPTEPPLGLDSKRASQVHAS